jgi:hypothetical protein
MRSPRYGRDEENISEPVLSFLRDRLGPDDYEELMRLLQGGEDLGGMVEEDEEPSPPFYGKYGERVKGPLDFTSKERRFQGGYRGGADAQLRMPSARAVNAFYARFPDAERLR